MSPQSPHQVRPAPPASAPSTGRRWNRRNPLRSVLVLCVVTLAMSGRGAHCWVSTGSIMDKRLGIKSIVSSLPSSASVTAIPMLSSNKSTNEDDLLERARLLREEAQTMEELLRSSQASRSSSQSFSSSESSKAKDVTSYTRLEDSIWTFSYRFASQPAPQEEGDEGQSSGTSNTIGEKKKIVPRSFYSGKITIRFKGDGYSEQLRTITTTDDLDDDDASKQRHQARDIQIRKVWGWDKETSNEDNQEYLLFSMDVLLPESDPDLPKQSERFYFQARVETSKDGNAQPTLKLKDGTISVKKDVADATKGRWGLFNVAGILTQFRYVGDFIAKPSNGEIV